jgi:hypothetical protein
MALRVKNWDRYQHYKDRCPPWIKLATDTFQNYEFSRLQDASKLLAICIWTLAARSKNGEVPDDLDYIKGVGVLGAMVKAENLQELVTKGFLQRDSELLAGCEQSACSEREGETEREAEQSSPRPSERSSRTPIPGLRFACDGKIPEWDVAAEDLVEWKTAFPSIDIEAECRKALVWTKANPARRKTARGMPAFLVGWFGRTQNQGRNGQRPFGGANGGGVSAQAAELLARQRAETNA